MKMIIQVIGTGCTTCKNLYELTKKAVEELNLDYAIEYIDDVNKLIEMGVLSSPVLAIDGKIIMNGSTNNIEKIKELITNFDDSDDDKQCNCGCSCC